MNTIFIEQPRVFRHLRLSVLLCLLTILPVATRAESGRELWLRGDTTAARHLDAPAQDETTKAAACELSAFLPHDNISMGFDRSLPANICFSIVPNGDGLRLLAREPIGLLYGAYEMIRQKHTTGTIAAGQYPQPAFKHRLLNHWDNLDGSVERGYAGKSIWKWESINGDTGQTGQSLLVAIVTYARANASIGINGTVLNNVNASPKMLTTEYLKKVKVIADILRPYGIRVYLSINFATPMALGETPTADPKNKAVAAWWKRKVKEIYGLIPDFGGFLVKANSEGQPGPGDYGRSHADGANMLADALKPYDGLVMWRSFVYGASHKGEDRVKQAVSEFKPCDGKFRKNVILQSKNGPLDFQPREPYAPIFDQMEHTPQMAELQITQEYTGQSKHLVYLATMWKEFFHYVSPSRLVGVAGVANVGDAANWCGHPFSQANWYAFGRLAWNPDLSAEQIAREWLCQTFTTAPQFVQPMTQVMMESREACVDYMMPLGLHHIFAFDHHYGPQPDGFKADYPLEWCPVYYHQATADSIGFDRTADTGTGATAQYSQPYAHIYNKVETCPEEYLLWFHRLPWDYRMDDGTTLWQSLCHHYNRGVARVHSWRDQWQLMRPWIDDERWQHVDRLLAVQGQDAQQWRDVCLYYFQSFSDQPIATEP